MGTDIAYHIYTADSGDRLKKAYNNQQESDSRIERESEGYGGTVAQLSRNITFTNTLFDNLGMALDYIESRAKKRVDSLAVPFWKDRDSKDKWDVYLRRQFFAPMNEISAFVDTPINSFKPDSRGMSDPVSFQVPYIEGGEITAYDTLYLDMAKMRDYDEDDVHDDLEDAISNFKRINKSPDPYDIRHSDVLEWVIGGLVGI